MTILRLPLFASGALHTAGLVAAWWMWLPADPAPHPLPPSVEVALLRAEPPSQPRRVDAAEPEPKPRSLPRPEVRPIKSFSRVIPPSAPASPGPPAAEPAGDAVAPAIATQGTESPAAPAGASWSAEPAGGNPRPEYPMASRRQGEQGRVVVLARVDWQGMVVSTHLRQSSGFDRLDRAALEAIRQWRFTVSGTARPGDWRQVDVPVVFNLRG